MTDDGMTDLESLDEIAIAGDRAARELVHEGFDNQLHRLPDGVYDADPAAQGNYTPA